MGLPMSITKFLRIAFLWNISCGCFCNLRGPSQFCSINYKFLWRTENESKLLKGVLTWKPICRPGDISADQFNFINAFIRENKSYNSFRWTVYMSALFCKQQVWKRWSAQKMFSWKAQFFWSILPHACSVEFTNHPACFCWWFCCIRIFRFIIIIITIWIFCCCVWQGRYSCIAIINIAGFSFIIVWKNFINIIIIL